MSAPFATSSLKLQKNEAKWSFRLGKKIFLYWRVFVHLILYTFIFAYCVMYVKVSFCPTVCLSFYHWSNIEWYDWMIEEQRRKEMAAAHCGWEQPDFDINHSLSRAWEWVSEQANEWAKLSMRAEGAGWSEQGGVSKWAVWANEQMGKWVAQYLHLDSWPFKTTVRRWQRRRRRWWGRRRRRWRKKTKGEEEKEEEEG